MSKVKSPSLVGYANRVSLISASFRALKPFSWSGPQWNFTSFLVRSIIGAALSENSGINLR